MLAGSRLSLVSGTSGANGAISITANSLAAATNTTLKYTAAGSGSGALTGIPGANDTLSGTIKIQVGTNAAQTINVDAADNDNTLTGLMQAINNAGLGVTASIVTNSDGTESLSMTTGTGGGALSVTPALTDTASPLAYTQTVAGTNAALTVDGVNLTSASNTVTNLIPGVTFQLLAPSGAESDGSLEQVQVIIGNNNTAVESAINQMVTDYNSLVSAINTQQGNDSTGKAEPLFGSPTLALLGQQLLGSVNQQNPNGYLTPLSVNSSTALTGQMTLRAGSGALETFVMGEGTSSGNTIYTGDSTMQSLVDSINAANASTPVTYASAAGDSGSLTAGTTASLNGTLSIQTGSGAPVTIYLGPSSGAPTGDVATGNATDTLASLETYINAHSSTLGVTASMVDNGDGTSSLSLASTDASALAVTSGLIVPGLGVSAGITNSGGQSTLTLMSQTAGSAGALTANSTIAATSQTALAFTGIGGGGGVNANGVLDPIPSANDILSGSLSIQVGNGTAQTITIDSSDNTLAAPGANHQQHRRYRRDCFRGDPGGRHSASFAAFADGGKRWEPDGDDKRAGHDQHHHDEFELHELIGYLDAGQSWYHGVGEGRWVTDIRCQRAGFGDQFRLQRRDGLLSECQQLGTKLCGDAGKCGNQLAHGSYCPGAEVEFEHGNLAECGDREGG